MDVDSLDDSMDIQDNQNKKICSCGKTFTNAYNLRRHVKNSHPNDLDAVAPFIYKNKENFEYSCGTCGKNFSKVYDLHYHEKKIHNRQAYQIDNQSKICPLCNVYKSSIKLNLLQHLEGEHEIALSKMKITFSSAEEFNEWKAKFEGETLSNFVMRCTKAGKRYKSVLYECHRSQSFVSKGKGKRHLKTQGSCKTGRFCPASINVKVDQEGIYNVDVIETHVGHHHDVGHLQLSKQERSDLAVKVASQIPFDCILDSIRDGISETSLKRIHLLTRKDLHNVENTFNLRDKAVRHSNDAISIDSWASEMLGECVLFYKPQDCLSSDQPELKSEDFVLIIQNDSQSQMLIQFGDDCVCLDSTHDTNNYNFELHTLLVIDDMRQGIPCGFLISNRSDKTVLKIFFSRVKTRSGNIKPRVFMTDMAEAYFNAWLAIMGMPTLRLFCSWHVDRAWRNHLTKVNTKEKKIEVYKKLRILQQETDASAFNTMIDEFYNILKADSDTVEFANYFKSYYMKNCRQWAYCYRVHSGLNTNMHLEKMHQTIKYIYLKGKRVKRLDKAVHAIMRFVRDKFYDRLILLNKGKITNKIRDIRSRHKTSTKLDSNLIIKNGDGWDISSTSKDSCEIYHIEETKVNCDCQLICPDCEICIHRYCCSCLDSSIKWNMCKHIHLLCKFRQGEEDHFLQPSTSAQIGDEDTLYIDTNQGTKNTECEQILADLSKDSNSKLTKLEDEKTALIHRLIKQIGTIDSAEKLGVVRKIVAPISPTLKAMDNMKNSEVLSFRNKNNNCIPHNSKITPQRRLFSTKKRRPRKEGVIKKPTTAEAAAISFSLAMHNIEQ